MSLSHHAIKIAHAVRELRPSRVAVDHICLCLSGCCDVGNFESSHASVSTSKSSRGSERSLQKTDDWGTKITDGNASAFSYWNEVLELAINAYILKLKQQQTHEFTVRAL